jgi:hypothetical protein
MYAAAGTDGELILTNKTEKQLASRLLRNFVIGITCTIEGAFVISGAIVWGAPPAGKSGAGAERSGGASAR